MFKKSLRSPDGQYFMVVHNADGKKKARCKLCKTGVFSSCFILSRCLRRYSFPALPFHLLMQSRIYTYETPPQYLQPNIDIANTHYRGIFKVTGNYMELIACICFLCQRLEKRNGILLKNLWLYHSESQVIDSYNKSMPAFGGNLS